MKSGRAERDYARSLKSVAQHVGELIAGFGPLEIHALPSLMELLAKYAEALTPWAQMTASRMLGEVNGRDRDAWRSLGNLLSVGLHKEIAASPVGDVMRELLDQQVTLIKSLPLEAAQRVHELTLKGLENSTRPREIAQEIARSGEITKSRAILIARTEVSRTATVLTQSRAESIGCVAYVWETSRDGAVRPSHKAMQGKTVEWTSPPTLDGLTGHAGALPNCRCWCNPIIAGLE